jgi:hypothetical protein
MKFLPENFQPLNSEELIEKAKYNFADFKWEENLWLIAKIPLVHRTTSENAIKIS